MIPTKTYPLSAIIGNQLTDKERIAELAEAFNKVCDENADFVAQSVTDENRIAELQNAFEDAVTRAEKAENRLAELEAYLKHAEGHAAELEAEVKALRRDAERWNYAIENCMFDCPNCVTPWKCNGPHITGGPEFTAHIDAALQPDRRKGERRKYTRITADRRQAK